MYAYFIANYAPFKSSPASPKPVGRFAAKPGALRRGLQAIRQSWKRRQTIYALQELDEHVLRDIGLQREQIPMIVKNMHANDTRRSGTTPLTAQAA
ncbi:DUF1127 domain-containing protein [Sulfitobacter sp. S0837]|uniref:DUF1127 domain-containing protein n=1 Tax=Sulfitobacter maritimus TaxID=2741719 RepID=UPI0015818027|nr:DUF1127 domain-containing protein [Sulfitobacter maritimus]NUH63940.1 DUF1127 domain-containing protein [Sulfitobacter maritimus]